MLKKALLIGVGVPAAVAALVWIVIGPGVLVEMTGRPLYVDCGDFEPAECEDMWRAAEPPITWLKIDPTPAGSGCADFWMGYWWPFIDPTALYAEPFC